MLTSFVTSAVRTYVPLLVGVVLTWLAAHLGFVLSTSSSEAASAIAVAVVTAVYYGVARFAETKVPAFGWLLGVPAAPSYGEPGTAAGDLGAVVEAKVEEALAHLAEKAEKTAPDSTESVPTPSSGTSGTPEDVPAAPAGPKLVPATIS